MMFGRILDKIKSKKEKYNELKIEDDALHKLEERKLSANERELNKILKQKREENIKRELDKYHKQESKEYWHKDIIAQKPLFNNNKKLFGISGGKL